MHEDTEQQKAMKSRLTSLGFTVNGGVFEKQTNNGSISLRSSGSWGYRGFAEMRINLPAKQEVWCREEGEWIMQDTNRELEITIVDAYASVDLELLDRILSMKPQEHGLKPGRSITVKHGGWGMCSTGRDLTLSQMERQLSVLKALEKAKELT